jgi:hypothetical protein
MGSRQNTSNLHTVTTDMHRFHHSTEGFNPAQKKFVSNTFHQEVTACFIFVAAYHLKARCFLRGPKTCRLFGPILPNGCATEGITAWTLQTTLST